MLNYGIAIRKTPQGMDILEEMNKVLNEEEFTNYVNAYMKNLTAGAQK
jgi:hypothetical protein